MRSLRRFPRLSPASPCAPGRGWYPESLQKTLKWSWKDYFPTGDGIFFVSSSPQGICRVFAGTCSCSFRRLKLKSARKHQQCFALGAHRKIRSKKVDSDKLTAKWTLIFCRLMITNYLTSSDPHPDILFWHSWKAFYLTVYLAYVLSRSWGPAVRSAHRDLAAVEVRQLGPLRSGARSWRRGGEGRGRQRQEASSTDKI